MPTLIRTDGEYAVEQSSYLITLDFFDEDDQPVVPISANWSLTDENGAVINSRDQVTITPLAATVDVFLSGPDLVLSTGFSGESENRVFLLEAIYNSSRQAGATLKDQLTFPIMQLTKIDNP